MPTNNRSTKAAQSQTADEISALIDELEDGAPPVAPSSQQAATAGSGRPSTSGRNEDIQREREQVAALYAGIRQQYFELHGVYPSNIGLEDEGAKHLMSVMFGINLMRLGGMRAEATGMDREAAYISILRDLGVDLTPFVVHDITGKQRFNWRYHQMLSYKQAQEIRDRILSAYSADLRKDK